MDNASALTRRIEAAQTELQFTEGLPLTLVSMLERRYLLELRGELWRIGAREGDNAFPLLREVVGLGRPHEPGEWARVMPHVLAATHDPGHAVVMLLHGSSGRHRLYFGSRRQAGAGARSTEDFLSAQEGALRSHLPGLRLGDLSMLDAEEMPEAAAMLQTAPAQALVTGIPSRRAAHAAFEPQGLDQIVRAVGNQDYALMLVAEPLEPQVIDATLDACRHLKGEVHAYIRRTITRSKGGSESTSSTEAERDEKWAGKLPYFLYGLAAFAHLASPLAPGVLSGVGGVFQMAGMMSFGHVSRQGRSSARQVTTGENWTDTGGVELLDANAEACEQLLQRHIDRLQSARSGGWWRTAVYLSAESDAALHAVGGALRGMAAGDATHLEPLRTIFLPDHILRPCVERGRVLSLLPPAPGGDEHAASSGHPLGAPFDALATCVNSDELSVLFNLPRREIPGLPMRDQSEFSLSAPAPTKDSIRLGSLEDSMGRDIGPLTVTSASLNRHVFVTGITGYGKTNTCMKILLEAYDRFGVPFLVVEPAKAEYRRLIWSERLKGNISVFTVGGGVSPFRLNPLAPVPGVPLGRHIDMLKAVFNASFPMFAGMPYVLEEALLEVYAERGWSLYTSENAYLDRRAGDDERGALTPSLEDLHDKIDVVLERKKYGQEIHRNMGAALRSRLRSLMVGNKGLALNTRRSIPLEEIFARPAVIELQNLGDDEEKAFVMALVFVLLYQYAEVRQRDLPAEDRGGLQHLTLIEEAHRLLQATRGAASAESGDPRAKAVSMFTDMLAEMRAYGEGFVIADQIPTKLAPETLKNSNLKIIHRLASPDDRQAAGDCINLTDWQKRHLNNLPPGLAVVHDERIGEAVLTRIDLVKDALSPDAPREGLAMSPRGVRARDRHHLRLHAGCGSCPSPCDFLHLVAESGARHRSGRQLGTFMEELVSGDADAAWGDFNAWRARETAARPPLAREGVNGRHTGELYCAATQLTFTWLGAWLAARHTEPALTPPDRLAREDAARAVGALLLDWLSKQSLDDAGRETFGEARRRINESLSKGPPVELEGCEQCPTRCQMLPYVRQHVAGLTKLVTPALLANTAGVALLATLERVTSNAQETIPALARRGKNDPARRHWLYCLLTNLETSPAAAPGRDSLLALIRADPEDPDAAELGGMAGYVG